MSGECREGGEVKAVLVVNQVEEVASLAAAEGLLLRVAWLVVG